MPWIKSTGKCHLSSRAIIFFQASIVKHIKKYKIPIKTYNFSEGGFYV